MDGQSTVFLEVMVGIAVVGLLAFLVLLVARGPAGARPGDGAGRAPPAPHWAGILLAVVLLIVVMLVVVWRLPPLTADLAPSGWREGPRALVFFGVMLAAGAVGLVAYLGFLLAGTAGGLSGAGPAGVAAAPAANGTEAGSGLRMLGLLALGLAFLALSWAYLDGERQYALVHDLLYPASFAVALVLLFDKATRAWSVKGGGASAREWLLCDALVFLLVLGFLDLSSRSGGEDYGVLWDVLHIALFFLAFWLLDRTASTLRFLAAYGYLMVLPILHLIAAPSPVPDADGVLWWTTVWPFFFLAALFFVLEIIMLVAWRDWAVGMVALVKDGVFIGAYAILLIGAIPAPA